MERKETATSVRKKEHIEICLTDDASFLSKQSGFEHYDFIHNAVTEVDYKTISLKTGFFGKSINYPFLISCMTGGTVEAESINANLAAAAEELKIPIGVGSQRQSVESSDYYESFKIIRKNAPSVPVLGNVGAAQLVKYKDFGEIKRMIDMIEADVMVIHLNSAQELIQREGEPDFKGLFKKLKKLCNDIRIPVIAKEVGAGISKEAAKTLLGAGVKGIDVAGAGGTSWTKVELIRSGSNPDAPFAEWGNPTSYCIRTVAELKRNREFLIIGSGGINSGIEIAKALALGADIAASARIVLKELDANGVKGVVNLINNWFLTVKKVMYLTGAQELKQLNRSKIIRKREFF